MEDDRNGRNQLFGAMESGISLGFPDPPDVFFDEMRRCFRLDGGGRMLALWCGAGRFLPLAEDFETVLIVDPEPGRLAEAMREADRLGIDNVILLEGGIEVLHPRMGQFRLVVVQDAFLRKDRKRLLTFLGKMTEPEGGIAIADVHRCGPLADWQKVALEVLRNRIGGRLPEGWPETLRHSAGRHEQQRTGPPFRRVATFTHIWTRKLTIDKAVTGILSALCPFPGVTFKERQTLEEVLRAALRDVEPSGLLEERLRLKAVFAWKGESPLTASL